MNRKRHVTELERATLEGYRGQAKYPVVVVLDDVRSMSNVGSIFRTCDAFNVEKLVLCGITGTPPHREIQKTALGATESVEWEYEPDILDAVQRLAGQGYETVVVEQCRSSVGPEKLKELTAGKLCLVLGNEVTGVREEIIRLCRMAIEIPQEGTKHSLNVSVAAGIVLWEAYKAFRNAP